MLTYCHIWHLTFLYRTECEVTTVTLNKFNTYTHCGFIPLIFFLGATSLLVFSFTLRPLYQRHPLNSRLCVHSNLFAWFGTVKRLVPLLGIEPRLLGFTTCSLVTILIMLSQLPLLTISWFDVRGSYTGRRAAWSCTQFNITLIPGLLLLIDTLWPLQVSVMANRSQPRFAATLFVVSLFRHIRESSEKRLLATSGVSVLQSVCPIGRTRFQPDEFSKKIYIWRLFENLSTSSSMIEFWEESE